MSHKQRRRNAARSRPGAAVFAALGDETRLSLVAKLSGGQSCSISELTHGSMLTRQAITKHLRVLQRVGMVHSVQRGRASLFALNPLPIERMKDYLESVSEQWDKALSRLKSFVED